MCGKRSEQVAWRWPRERSDAGREYSGLYNYHELTVSLKVRRPLSRARYSDSGAPAKPQRMASRRVAAAVSRGKELPGALIFPGPYSLRARAWRENRQAI